MNKTIFIGRLTKDPKGSEKYQRFTLAVDRKFAKEGELTADFIPCVAFGKLGEFVAKYLKQGTKIALTGHMQSGSYKNDKGETVYTLDCIADEIEFAESKKAEPPKSNDEYVDVDESALPFKTR